MLRLAFSGMRLGMPAVPGMTLASVEKAQRVSRKNGISRCAESFSHVG